MSRVRGVTVRQLIPEGLAQMAPGPELGVLLGGLNISALTGTIWWRCCAPGPGSCRMSRLSSTHPRQAAPPAGWLGI